MSMISILQRLEETEIASQVLAIFVYLEKIWHIFLKHLAYHLHQGKYFHNKINATLNWIY